MMDGASLDPLTELDALSAHDGFVARHIGPSEQDVAAMLRAVGCASLEELADRTVPAAIRDDGLAALPSPVDEAAALADSM